MWRASLNSSVKQLRFVLKQGPEHAGAWSFVTNKLPTIRMLNQNTMFSVTEINDSFATNSACHIIYGDKGLHAEEIATEGLTSAEFETLLKSKVEKGLTLERGEIKNNGDRSLPTPVVEAHKYVKYIDDAF
jgi:hypothetical protein